MNQPNPGELCQSCKHPLSEHYTTYGGQKHGCSHQVVVGGNQRDYDERACTCVGFSILFTAPAIIRTHDPYDR